MQQLNIKASLFLLIILLLVNVVYFIPIVSAKPDKLYEYYYTEEEEVYNFYGSTWVGQTFTPSVSFNVTYVKLLMSKYIGNPGILTVGIRATSGGVPIGNDLTNGTLDFTSLPAPVSWRQINLTEYTLQAGVQYAIVCRVVGTGADQLAWRVGTDPTYTRGTALISYNGGVTWTKISIWDFMFEVWGVPAWHSVESWNTVFKTPFWHVETWNTIIKTFCWNTVQTWLTRFHTINWNLVEVFKVVFPYSLMFYMRLSFAFTSCFLILISPALLTYGAKNRNRNIVLAGFILLIFAFVFISLVSNTTNV